MAERRTIDVAAERARIALAVLAALTHQQHVAVQPHLFDLTEGDKRRGT